MRLSVYLGCGAVLSFKEMDEVVCVIEACFRRDFMDFFFCGKKQELPVCTLKIRTEWSNCSAA